MSIPSDAAFLPGEALESLHSGQLGGFAPPVNSGVPITLFVRM